MDLECDWRKPAGVHPRRKTKAHVFAAKRRSKIKSELEPLHNVGIQGITLVPCQALQFAGKEATGVVLHRAGYDDGFNAYNPPPPTPPLPLAPTPIPSISTSTSARNTQDDRLPVRQRVMPFAA